MSGDHNSRRNTLSDLDVECMAGWTRHWSEEWNGVVTGMHSDMKDFGMMSLLCHEIYEQGFRDGFTARLSGVKDE